MVVGLNGLAFHTGGTPQRAFPTVAPCLLAGILALGAAAPKEGLLPLEPEVVVAFVGGEPIRTGELNRRLAAAFKAKKYDRDVLPILQAQVLADLVDRRLAMAYARRTQSGASEEEVDKALAELQRKLKAQGQSLADHLGQHQLSEAELRHQIAWQLSWERLLARYRTEDRLKSYFESHRREYDGTQVSVSHILLRPKPEAGGQAVDELVRRAESIRQEIAAGKMSFEEAARKHSAGPSSVEGGRLGPIPRRGVMDEAFSRAAFALEAGQVSPPVKTPFGVHLIRCDGITPGSKQLDDVRPQLEEALARELLEKLARAQRQYTPVEFTGKAPHFKPGTTELVVPNR
jgi:parvulin-like peptidyl-prolyl isomerase